MALGSVVIILTVVLPQFEPLFIDAHATLPLPTRIVIATSDFVRGFWWLGIGVLWAAFTFWKRIKRSPQLLLRCDKRLLKVPLIGQLLLRADIVRFTRTLGTLMQNGVTLGAGLAIAGEGVANSYLRTAIEVSALAIREGEGLAKPLTKTGCFPKLMLNMIQIGEESGRLEEMLGEVADIYEGEMQRSIDRMLALLVPILTIGMGLIVAFLVASMLMAMLSVNDLVL
jgi:general secretion pathway protein F